MNIDDVKSILDKIEPFDRDREVLPYKVSKYSSRDVLLSFKDRVNQVISDIPNCKIPLQLILDSPFDFHELHSNYNVHTDDILYREIHPLMRTLFSPIFDVWSNLLNYCISITINKEELDRVSSFRKLLHDATRYYELLTYITKYDTLSSVNMFKILINTLVLGPESHSRRYLYTLEYHKRVPCECAASDPDSDIPYLVCECPDVIETRKHDAESEDISNRLDSDEKIKYDEFVQHVFDVTNRYDFDIRVRPRSNLLDLRV